MQDAIRGFRDVASSAGAIVLLLEQTLEAQDPDSAAECLQCASKLRLEQEARRSDAELAAAALLGVVL